MSEDAVLVRIEGSIQIVTINRPAVRNAVNKAVAVGLANALAQLDAQADLHVGIITGAGGNFCAGMDLNAFAQGGSEPVVEGFGFAGLCEAPPKKPLIAAVEGHAVAGGCEIAMACDLIVAGRSASFGLPEVKRGLVASSGGLMRLPHRVPYAVAMEMAITGEPISAAQAHAYGLVNRLVEAGEALDAALRLAEQIDANAPLAVAASKRILASSRTWSDAEMFELQRPIARAVNASADAIEGATAFSEKRKAVWQGR
ncbi:crotonase/enoyl-CoA hydratase family protein [Variovorax sp. LjRoot175]|uniref:crotonase/enoyl-CoA hydratase family protein n=1 Tax=Variovorax sp. LjRoot175 TaxID=3342276 RepID=UPI003ECF282E